MLRPLREQMEACVQRLEAGTLEADDLRGLFTLILEALPSLEPPGRQVRHLVDLAAKLLGETAPHAVCRLADARLERAYLRFDDPGVILRQLHADQVFRYDHPNPAERCALCVEYQYQPNPALLVLWLAKALILSDRLQMPVVLVVIYLHQGRFQTFPAVHRVQAGGLTNEFRFETIRLWEHVDRIRSGELVELAPLLVLCEEGNPEEILREERDLILKANLEPRVTADLLGISYILGLRVESEGVVNAVFSQDELAEMKSQGLIGRWIQDAVAQERTAADQRLAEERARAEQRLAEASREWLTAILELRFQTVPDTAIEQVQAADAATCQAWLRLLSGCTTLEEFTKHMASRMEASQHTRDASLQLVPASAGAERVHRTN